MMHPVYELTLFDELELIKCQLIQVKVTIDRYNSYDSHRSHRIAQNAMNCLDSLYNKEFKNYLDTHYMQCYKYKGYDTCLTEDTYLIDTFNTTLSAYNVFKTWNKLNYLGVRLRNNWPKVLLDRWLCKKHLTLRDFVDTPVFYRDYTTCNKYYYVSIVDVKVIIKKLLRILREHINSIIKQNIKLYRHNDIKHIINHRPIELRSEILNL